MTASTRTANWTALLAGAVAHDVNNFVQGLVSARALAGAPGAASADADDMAATIEADLDRMRALGMALRTLASAADSTASTRLDEACAAALVGVEHGPGQLLRAAPIPATLRVLGPAVALRTVIASLLQHALAASPPTTTVTLAVHPPRIGHAAASNGPAGRVPGARAIVQIAAPEAVALGAIERERLDVALATTLPELRGDTSLILPGAIADGLGGAVYLASDSKTGLVLEVDLIAARPG